MQSINKEALQSFIGNLNCVDDVSSLSSIFGRVPRNTFSEKHLVHLVFVSKVQVPELLRVLLLVLLDGSIGMNMKNVCHDGRFNRQSLITFSFESIDFPI